MTVHIPEIEPPWSQGDSLSRVEQAAAGRGSRVRLMSDGSLLISCVNPAHEDRHPSLHATWVSTQHGGRTLLHCPACGEGIQQEEWAHLLGLEFDDLFDDRRWSLHHRPRGKGTFRPTVLTNNGGGPKKLGPLPARVAPQLDELLGRKDPEAPALAAEVEHEHTFREVCIYPYRDDANTLRQKVVRLACSDCGQKTFRQSYLGGSGQWVNNEPAGFEPMLYRQGAVTAAVAAGEPVWVMEGEKDADTAARMGLASTTNARGGAHFPDTLAPRFNGATVRIVLDRDDTGWVRGVALYDKFTAAGAGTVEIWLPAVTTAKADFTDHVEAGHGVGDLIQVPVAAVRAWAALRDVHRNGKRVDAADTEANAQLQIARHDRKNGRAAKAKDRDRFAERWAREAAMLTGRVVEAAKIVASTAAEVPDCDWAVEAVEAAQAQTDSVMSVLRSTYDQVGLALPLEFGQRIVLATEQQVTNTVAAQQDQADGTTGLPGPTRQGFEPRIVHGGGRGGGPSWVPGVQIHRTEYRAMNGELVEVKRVPVGRGEDTEWEEKFVRVINRDIRIIRKEAAESEDDLERHGDELALLGDRDGREARESITSLAKITHFVFAITASNGETELVRVRADEVENGAWLSNIQVAGLDFQRSRSGRDKVLSAINQTSTDWETVTSYRGTGWRHIDGKDVFVTADGAISADGWEPLATNLTGPLARYTWPNPSTDAQRLRAAFLDHSAGIMDRTPDRTGVVLLGTAYRAILCPNEWVTVLSASPGVGKTGLAALTMHHFGELHDRNKPMSSMSGQGGTMNANRWMMHMAKDVLSFFDDVAPTAGHDQAIKRLEETTRLISNQEGRVRSERDGQGVQDGTAPRTSGLITSELRPRAGTSGERRMLIVPLDRGEVRIEDIRDLDSPESRHGRALLMASFIRWIAQDHAGARDRAATLRDEYLRRIQDAPKHPAAWDHHAAKVAEQWAGWGLMLDFLTDTQALSAAEAERWRDRVDTALLVAAESCEDPDLVGSTAQRCRDLLQYALSSGIAHIADIQTGGAPDGLERRLGWKAASVDPVTRTAEWRTENKSLALGWVNTDPQKTDGDAELVCLPNMFEAMLKAASADLVDNVTLDLGTALRAMADEDMLKVSRRADGTIASRTIARTVFCQPDVRDPAKPMRKKMVVLRLGELLGSDDRDGHDDGTLPGIDPDGAPDAPSGPTTPADPAPAGTTNDTNDNASDKNGTEPRGDLEQLPVDGDETPDVEEEAPVGPDDYTDINRGGLRLEFSQEVAPGSCVVCGHTCMVSVPVLNGARVHSACFMDTTSTTLEQLTHELTPTGTHAHSHTAGTPVPETAPVPAGKPTARPAASTRARRAPKPSHGFRATAAVVDVDAIWMPDGSRLELESPIEHLGHLEELGRALKLGTEPMKWRTRPEAGLIVPTPALWEQLGVPLQEMPKIQSKRREWMATLSKDLPAITKAVDAGWQFGRGDSDPVLRGLTRLRRNDAEYGSVAILFAIDTPPVWGIDGLTVEPAKIARRLELFSQAVGLPFRGSPISTGLDLLQIVLPREVREALRPENAVDYSAIGPATAYDLEEQFNWTRTPMSHEQSGWLACYDRGGSYLASWSSLLLGYGQPELLDGDEIEFDPKRAGWWQVQLPNDCSTGGHYPSLLDPAGRQAGQAVWLTTPVLEYALKDLGLTVPILKAWSWPRERSVRALKGLGEVLRDALTQLREIGDEDAAATAGLVKQIYKTLSGHFISADSDTRGKGMKNRSSAALDMHHPYWFHAMRGQAKRAILHQILKVGETTGRWPLVVSVYDLVGYHTDTPDLVQAWPGEPAKLGEGLGQYKPARWAPMSDQLPYLKTGIGWGGVEATHSITDALPGGE